MAARFLEDFVVGESWTSPAVELTETDIIAFASINQIIAIKIGNDIVAIIAVYGVVAQSAINYVIASTCAD